VAPGPTLIEHLGRYGRARPALEREYLGVQVKMWSDYSGAYLGDDPARAMSDFGSFARRAVSAIRI